MRLLRRVKAMASRAKRRASAAAAARGCHFEPLEPRVLCSAAGLSVQAQSITVVSMPTAPVEAVVNVLMHVTPGNNPMLSVYDAELTLSPGGSDVSLSGAVEAPDAVFPGRTPQVFATGDVLQVSDLLPGPSQQVPINDGAGLFGAQVTVAAGAAGQYTAAITLMDLFDGQLDTVPVDATIDAAINVVPGSLDVDGNGQADALTDGILVARYLFGFTGPALRMGALGAGATRVTSGAIIAFLDATRTVMLDVDGNGQADALSDGVLFQRYLFGFRGSTLIQDAVAANATRTSAAQIEAFLASWMPAAPAPPGAAAASTPSGWAPTSARLTQLAPQMAPQRSPQLAPAPNIVDWAAPQSPWLARRRTVSFDDV